MNLESSSREPIYFLRPFFITLDVSVVGVMVGFAGIIRVVRAIRLGRVLIELQVFARDITCHFIS